MPIDFRYAFDYGANVAEEIGCIGAEGTDEIRECRDASLCSA